MTDVLKFGKKLFTFSVVAVTIVWSLGLAALVPATAYAETCTELEAGDLFKVPGGAAVYMVTADMDAMYFPSQEIFESWNLSFDNVTEIANVCFDNYEQATPAGVSYRPGTYLLKRVESPSIYVVLPGNQRMKVESPSALAALYGDNWGVLVRDIPSYYWSNYVAASGELTDAVPHNGMIVRKTGEDTVYQVMDGMLYEVTGLETAGMMDFGGVKGYEVADLGGLAVAGTTVTVASIFEDPTQLGNMPETPVVSGDLAVSLSAGTPTGVQAAVGSLYNDVLHFNLKAGSTAVEVTGVTLQKTGLLANTDISGISTWVGSERHGSIATALDDEGKVSIGFGNNPITVAANSTVTVSVKLNISSSATATNFQMGVVELETGADVTGFPVTGNQATVVAGTLASYTVSAGTVAGYASEAAATSGSGQLEIGELQKEVGKWTFAESGNEDALIENLTFFLSGTSNSDTELKNWTVYGPANEVLGTAVSSNDRYVTVPVNYTLKKGYSKTLSLKVDIVDGSNKYFSVSIQNDYDVMAKGMTTGYYVAPGSFSSQTPTNSWFKMKQGTLSVQRAATSPSASVPAGVNDEVLGLFELKAIGEDVEIRKMALEIYSGDANDPDMTGNVKVQSEDGSKTYLSTAYTNLIDGTTSGATFATGTARNLSTYLTIKSGETVTIRVVGNIADGANASDTYAVKVGAFYLKRLSTLDYQTKPNTTTAYLGNTMNVTAASLTLANNTSVGNSTLATGATNVVVGSMVLAAGSSENVTVTTMAVDMTNASNVLNLGLWDGDTLLGTEVVTPVIASNTFSFSLDIPKNTTKVLNLKADVATTASSTSAFTVSALTAVGAGTGQSAITFTATSLQTTSFGAARLIITNDSVVENAIVLPTAVGEKSLIATHKYEAVNSDIELRKVTYSVLGETSTSTEGTSANYGIVELRDPEGNVLASAQPVDSTATTLTFTGFTYTIPAGLTKKLSLYSTVNGSGVMTPASTSRVGISSDANTSLEAYSSTGLLARSVIGYGSTSAEYSADDTNFAPSSLMLFHNTAPVIALSNSPSGSKTPANETDVFTFSVANPGTRDMRVGSSTVYVSVSGLAGAGSISTFNLYDGSTLLATDSSTTMDSSTPTSTVTFNTVNDISSRLANLVISAGETKTFKVTVNTSNIRTGMSSGNNAYLTMSLDGAVGYSASADTQEDNWADGVFTYFYTPVNGSENTDEYGASDSYDINGNTLTF
ncbi:hypothetical protein C0581_02885 [Candidatus Parcubacteria bacterium]|nr:MAG: hypothetical protein C0581_02885 [Candidatus Parcubacteria bacterium]